jgi:hypothetical protein
MRTAFITGEKKEPEIHAASCIGKGPGRYRFTLTSCFHLQDKTAEQGKTVTAQKKELTGTRAVRKWVQVPPKRQHISAKLLGATSQKTDLNSHCLSAPNTLGI